MTNLAPNNTADSAFVPALSNPFLLGNPLESGQNIVGLPASVPQMMPVIPELSGAGSALGDRRSQAQGSELSAPSFSGDSQAVLQALADELAPIYPQVAKALIAPTLDSALQSGVGLFSRGSQLIESTIDSGRGAVINRAGDVGNSVREWVDGALSQWQAENNSVRTGLNQQAQALVSDLTSIAAEMDDSTWMGTVKRRLAKARARVENATDGIFSSLGYVGDAAIGKDETAVVQAMQRLEQTLLDFRNSSEFAPTLKTAFGDHGQTPEAEALVDDLIAGANGPAIKIVDAQRLLGDGAFGNNTIFIADEVVAEAAENAEALDDVLLEEVGHYFDQALNTVDSAGDEGEIFARLVQGEDISTAEMQTLKSENDHSTLTFNGTTISVENRRFLGGSANHAFTAPPKPVTKPVMTPVTPVDKLIQPTPVIGSDRRLYLQAGTVDRFDEAMAKQRQQSAPTPVAQPVQPVQPASGNGTVEVQAGDTLSVIAAQHGVQWTDLRKPDGTAFTETEARSLQIGADVVLPNQPTSAPVTPPSAVVPASPAAIQQEIVQLQDDAALLATASPYASEVMQAEAVERVSEEKVAEEDLSEIEQLQNDAELLATASPAAAKAMQVEAEVLIAAEKRQTIQRLQNDAELLATASPAAARVMQAEAEALIAEDKLPAIEQLQNDAELLATASPAADRAMQAEAEVLIKETERQKIEQLQDDAALLATASPAAAKAMQAEVDEWFAEERRQEITALNQVGGQGLEHRFMGTYPEAAELLGTNNYADNFLSGFDLDLVAAEQAANDYNDNDNHVMIQSIFDPVVADKPTTIDEYSVQVELPENVSPDDILLNLAIDMDGFLGGEFADLGDFKNQGEAPVAGQVIDIDVKDGMRIFGWKPWFTESPFNAPVIITEIEDNNFTVQTIKYNNAEHLLHGTREWGYEHMPNGTVNFYTRGISVEDIKAAEGVLWIDGAKEGEYRFWNAQIDGIENYVVEQGGSIVEGSRVDKQTEGPSGNDIWQTLTAEQQEMTRQRQIEELERELATHLETTRDARGRATIWANQRTRAIQAEITGWENR